jgi:SOS-response transcriptional repressor LexA
MPAVKSGDWCQAEGETAEELARLKASSPTPRDAVAHIMDTFPIVKRKDGEKWGEYRTKRVILEIYDAMQKAIATGEDYQTFLDPPPADIRVAHPREPAVTVSNTEAPILPFQRVRPSKEQKYTNCVPLLSLKVAAGGFSGDQAVEFEDWVEIKTSHHLRKGMFVAQVVGKSMEPVIPNGSYCLFRYPVLGTRQGKIVLVQHHDIADPETGGSYTVKRYQSEKVPDGEGGWQHSIIRLLPENPEYKPIPLREVDEGEVRVIAEFIELLRSE